MIVTFEKCDPAFQFPDVTAFMVSNEFAQGQIQQLPLGLDRRVFHGFHESLIQHDIIERAVILNQGPILAFGDWLRELGGASPATSFPTLDEAERAHIVKALEQCGWRVSGERGAARLLELPATTLESRIKRMGLTMALPILRDRSRTLGKGRPGGPAWRKPGNCVFFLPHHGIATRRGPWQGV